MKSLKESFLNNIRESGKNLKRKAEEKLYNLITGSGYKTKCRARKQQSATNSDTVSTKNKKHSKEKIWYKKNLQKEKEKFE